MKKYLLILSCALALLTTGCIKNSYNIEIDDKDNITISDIGAINSNFIKTFGPNAIEEIKSKIESNKKEAEKEGYKAEFYDDGTYVGLKQTKSYKLSIYGTDDLPKGFSTNQKKPVIIDKKFFKTNYIIDWDFDIKKASKEEDSMADFNQMQQQQNNMSNSNFMNEEEDDNIVSKEKTTDPETGKVTETTTYKDGSFSKVTYNEQEKNDFENSMSSMFESSGMAPVADLTIKIPREAKEHNANEEIKKFEYKWNLISEDPVKINLVYEKTNVLNIVLLIIFSIIGIFCVLVLFGGTKRR